MEVMVDDRGKLEITKEEMELILRNRQKDEKKAKMMALTEVVIQALDDYIAAGGEIHIEGGKYVCVHQETSNYWIRKIDGSLVIGND